MLSVLSDVLHSYLKVLGTIWTPAIFLCTMFFFFKKNSRLWRYFENRNTKCSERHLKYFLSKYKYLKKIYFKYKYKIRIFYFQILVSPKYKSLVTLHLLSIHVVKVCIGVAMSKLHGSNQFPHIFTEYLVCFFNLKQIKLNIEQIHYSTTKDSYHVRLVLMMGQCWNITIRDTSRAWIVPGWVYYPDSTSGLVFWSNPGWVRWG